MPSDHAATDGQGASLRSRTEAFRHFATFDGPTQSQQHIKPLHEYVTARLVLEGGFAPHELRPRPPLKMRLRRRAAHLIRAPDEATSAEATILGGLKTKNVDIVVTKDGIGPVLAISCKGMTGAFRNLTNRLEETIGECTNIHIGYPMLVFGYLFIARANRTGAGTTDIALTDSNQPVEPLKRFHAALTEMTGRQGVRNDMSRYEAVGMALVDTRPGFAGQPVDAFPPCDSPIHFANFFATLYRRYDERYVVGAPQLKSRTRRIVWAADSPALMQGALPTPDYAIRTEAS